MNSRSPALRLLFRAGITVISVFAAAGAPAALANDNFAARELISGGTPWGDFSRSGSTVGAGALDEVDEKMAPSPLDHASVWFEWVAPNTGAWEVMAQFPPGVISGLAAYIMPAGGTQMAEMEPAGACVAPADAYPSIALAVQRGQRVILRVWTVKTPAVTGRGFSLTLEGLPPRFDQYGGTLPVSSQGYTPMVRIELDDFSTEPEDARLEAGRWAPASAATRLRFVVPTGTPRAWQLSLLPESSNVGRFEILRPHPEQPGRYQPLVPPGTALQFTPVPGENIYIRVSTTLPFHALHRDRIAFVLHWSTEADERDSTALSLRPGSSIWANMFGATPSAAPLPVESAATLDMPDIWVRLLDLPAGDRFRVSRSVSANTYVQLYRELQDGGLEAIASGADIAFTAISGAAYSLRIVTPTFLLRESVDYTNFLSLSRVNAIKPSNDDWTGAIVLQAPTPDPIRGDLQGATASETEAYVLSGTPPAPAINPRYRSVWYALDLPAAPELYSVSAWGNGVILFTASSNGVLTELPAEAGKSLLPMYQPDGSRIYAMVQGGADRFLLMITPVPRARDYYRYPIALIEGQPSRYFPNWVSAEPELVYVSTWHSWTAPATGQYHFSSLESANNQYDYAIFAGPAPVSGPALNIQSFSAVFPSQSRGKVLTLDATAGAAYLIRTTAPRTGGGPAVLRVSKAKGASPYTFWRQSFPAWDDALDDPLADPDGDGASNLLELAAAQHPGFKSSVFGSVSETVSPPGFSVLFASFASISRTALSGPPGCTPFKFTAEKSSDLRSWQSLGETFRVDVPVGDPFRYVRFRVSR